MIRFKAWLSIWVFGFLLCLLGCKPKGSTSGTSNSGAIQKKSANIKLEMAEAELKVTYGKIQFALFEFRSKFGRNPTQEEGLEALVTQPPGLEGWGGPYMDKRYLLDPWKNKFKYSVEGSQAKIISLGADGREGGEKDDADIDLNTILDR